MKIKTSDLTGAALDWAVARAKGIPATDIRFDGRRIYRWLRDDDGNLTGSYMTGPELLFSTQWEAGGPIIERESMDISAPVDLILDEWQATCAGKRKAVTAFGPTPLIAAMRCFVASKLGEVVDVPKELS